MSLSTGPTGRLSRSEPILQNTPGSFADALSWAFERGDFSVVAARLSVGDLEPDAPVAPAPRESIIAMDFHTLELRVIAHG